INVVHNQLVFHTTDFANAIKILDNPQIIHRRHLIVIDAVPLPIGDMNSRLRAIFSIAIRHNPVFVGIFIDVELNNVVILSSHEYDVHNREFMDEVRNVIIPNPIFEYGNLHNVHVKRQPPENNPLINFPIIAGEGYKDLYAIRIKSDNRDVGGPVFSYHGPNIANDDDPAELYNVRLNGILTGAIGNIAFMTQYKKIKEESNLFLVSSTGELL
ncbi:18280_t:CDS:2, partial [Racocetra persica]